jgi:RHS repeat-associated protein
MQLSSKSSMPTTRRWPRRFRIPTKVGILLTVVGALLLGLIATPSLTSVTLATAGAHKDVALTSGGGVTNSEPSGAGPQWGGGSEVQNCTVCSPSGLLAHSGGQSTQPDQPVNPMIGDFTTTESLFSVPAIDGSLSLDLTYDSGAATAGRDYGGQAGLFGWGWSSEFSSGVSVSSGAVTVNDDNTAEVTFSPPTGSDSCPVGDYEDFQKYTVVNSNTAYCAPNRTDAQLGWFSTYAFYQLDKSGGAAIATYNIYGQLASQGNLFNTDAINFNYQATQCGGTGIVKCYSATDSDNRTIKAGINGVGEVVDVTDPMGRQYTFGYTDGQGNLNSVTTPAPATSGTSTTNYAYQVSAASPYQSDMISAEDPDGASHTEHISYYSYGMVQSVTDPSGAATQYQYGDTDCATSISITSDCTDGTQVTNVTYPDGELDQNEYADGLLIAAMWGATNNGGADTESYSFTYTQPTASDQDTATQESVSGPNGLTATTLTDSQGNVVSFTDPNGNTTTSMYNDTGSNDLDELCWTAGPTVSIPSNASCSNPPSGSTYFTYDSYGDRLTATDPLDNTTRYGYYTQAGGMLCWEAAPTVTGAGGSCTGSSYPTTPNGAPTDSTAYTYDANGDQLSSTTAYNDATYAAKTSASYNTDGQVTSTVPPDGQSGGSQYDTSYAYFGDSSVNSVTAPMGLTTYYTYDAAGNTLTVEDPTGWTSNAYDADNRLCWTLRSTSSSSNLCTAPPSAATIDDAGAGYVPGTDASQETIDPDGYQTTYAYADKQVPTEPTQTTEVDVGNSAENLVTNTSYDYFGNVCDSGPATIASTGGACAYTAGDTMTQYNNEGQLMVEEDASGTSGDTMSFTYTNADVPDQATSRTNGLSETTSYTYDADGNLIQTQEPDSGYYVSNGYDTDGRLCYAAPLAWSSSSSCANPPTGATGISQYLYNPANEHWKMLDNYGTTSQTTSTYLYDLSGNLLSAGNDNGETTTYAYNPANQVTCVSYPVTSGMNCQTNATPGSGNDVVADVYSPTTGQLTSTTDWLLNTVNFENYNAYSEVGLITYGSTGESATYDYDNAGNVAKLAYSGPISALNSLSNKWTEGAGKRVSQNTTITGANSLDNYDQYGRVASATSGLSSASDAYVYNNNGEIASDTPSGGTQTSFGYNEGAELTSMTNGSTVDSYAYDANGNLCASLASSSTPSCTSPTSSTSVGGWNRYNQMCSFALGSTGSCSTAPTTPNSYRYTYDGNGLRMTEQSSTSSQAFDWDTVSGGSIPLDINDGTSSYVYGPLLFGGTAPVEQIKGSTASFIVSTPSGVQAVFTSSTTPVLQELAAYSIWGVQSIKSGSVVTPFGFQGSYTDNASTAASTGLIYLIDRYYDPATDQFLSVDPDVAETGQPYAFTGDDPLNATDPLGLSGDVQAFEQYTKKVNANKAYCRSHPDALGHSCGGLLHEIGGTISKGASHTERVAMVVGHTVRTHPVQTIGLVAGTIALAIPGAEGAGAELDEASLSSMVGGDLSEAATSQTLRGIAGAVATTSDAYECSQSPGVSSCGAMALGGGGLLTQNLGAELVGYVLSAADASKVG